MANNDDWLTGLQYMPFLRDIGRHFTINRMLTMDSVRLRLEREQPLTFLEFNYMILQGYDFVELKSATAAPCRWAARINGATSCKAWSSAGACATTELFGLTSPLIATASGAKMGKTAAGAVWLSPKRLSPYDYWQFWRNTEDGDVGRFLRMFTELPLDEIPRLEQLKGAEINAAKEILATEATRLCHGERGRRRGARHRRPRLRGRSRGGPADLRAQGRNAALIIDVAVALGMASPKSEARRWWNRAGCGSTISR